jgi:hypothetical protein
MRAPSQTRSRPAYSESGDPTTFARAWSIGASVEFLKQYSRKSTLAGRATVE